MKEGESWVEGFCGELGTVGSAGIAGSDANRKLFGQGFCSGGSCSRRRSFRMMLII